MITSVSKLRGKLDVTFGCVKKNYLGKVVSDTTFLPSEGDWGFHLSSIGPLSRDIENGKEGLLLRYVTGSFRFNKSIILTSILLELG